MKKTLVVLVALALLSLSSAFSQKGFVNAGFAFGFGAGTQQITQKVTATTTEGVYGSFGEGFRFGASGGVMFNKNLGAEFGFTYLVGKTFEGSGQNNTIIKNSSSGFLLGPTFILATGMEKINPYAKLGIVLGFLKAKFENNSQNSEFLVENTGGLSLGLVASLGVAFELSHMFSVFGEFTVLSLTQNPSQAEIVKSTANGQAQPNQGKKFDFKDTFDQNAAANTVLSVRNPFSSAGISVGARIYI
jgi:hypothetical protein